MHGSQIRPTDARTPIRTVQSIMPLEPVPGTQGSQNLNEKDKRLWVVPASGISSYMLGDELALFSDSSARLYRLNTTAAFIWCCCEDRQRDYPGAGRHFQYSFGFCSPRCGEHA